MFGLDERIAELGSGSIVVALLIAVLLGLRHATDPDHVTAIATLILNDRRGGTRHAGRLGAAWGLGHAVTLLAFGLPAVLFARYLPDAGQRALELLIGVLIVALAVRLLVRWYRGYLHDHAHTHDGFAHAHPHMHDEHSHVPHPHVHGHSHDNRLRSPRTAFGIGLVHGAGGSAGVGILLVAAIPGRAASAGALVVLAAGTAISMAVISAALGRGFGSRCLNIRRLTPVFGVAGTIYGSWYALAAVGALPYFA